LLILGTLLMGFFLYLVGGLQARFGHWSVAVVEDHDSASEGIIVYLFVCSFVVIMDPVSWTYPDEIVSFPSFLYIYLRGRALSLATASNWIFNLALAWAVPPSFGHIAWKTYFIFWFFMF
ncbi:hypothetical protein K435DRAFT_574593, partial [Dendrothele bispora CBS 962.96]